MSVVFCVVPDPFSYITFFGLRKHEEMCNRLVCIVLYMYLVMCIYYLFLHYLICSNIYYLAVALVIR